MAKFFVELNEILTYNLTVEAADADAAWDEALKTSKFVSSNYDDNDTECRDITEVPEDLLDCTEPDEVHASEFPERDYDLIVGEDGEEFPYTVRKNGEVHAKFVDYDSAINYILWRGAVEDDGEVD